MKSLGLWLNSTVRGRVALAVSGIAAAIALGLVLSRLGWSHWPNLVAVVTSSWLYLLIIGSIAAWAIQSVAERKEVLSEIGWCIAIGVGWDRLVRFIPLPIPFDVGHALLVYGLTGLAAVCLRRAKVRDLFRTTLQVPTPSSIKKPGAES